MADPVKLERFIKDAGLSFKQNSKSYIFTCPLCHGAEKLYIRKEDGKFACWRCKESVGFQGYPEYALQELTGQDIASIKNALYGLSDQAGITLDVPFRDLAEEGELPEIEKEEEFKALTMPYHCLPIDNIGAKKGLEYLVEQRKIPLDVAKAFDIRYSPEKKAIMFPAWVGEKLLGWQYRTIEKTSFLINDTIFTRVKAMSSKDLPKDRIFMFQNNLIGATEAVLCEGPIDAIKCYRSGVKGVCSLGKAVSQKQANILLRSGIKKLYVALDPDAVLELDPLLDKFNDSVEIMKVNIPYSKDKSDLGALSFEEAAVCIKNAEPLRRNSLYMYFPPLQGFN